MWHSPKLLWHYQVRPAEIWLFNSVFYANSGIHDDLITPVTSRPSIRFVWNSDWIRDNMSWICLLNMIKIPLISYSFLCLKNIDHYFWQGVYKIFSGTTSIRTHTQNTNSQWHKTHTITSQVNLFIIFSLLRFWSARRSYVNFGTSILRTRGPGLFGLKTLRTKGPL